MSFYAKVRKTDDLVVGLSVLDPSQASKFPSDADVALIEITEAQYMAANAGLLHDGSNIPKFKWVDPNFVANPDTRPVVTFTPDTIKVEVGDVVTVDIDHSGGLNTTAEFNLAGTPTRIDFVSGTATAIVVDTSRALTFQIGSQQGFRVAAPLQVTVFARDLGPKD